MENATKALLIAAAILIAIVVITLGVFVLGRGSTLVKDNSDMSDVEISTYNAKFETYFGTNVRGAQVKQLLSTIKQHNAANVGDESKTIKFDSTGDIKDVGAKTETGKTYEVKATDWTTGGLIQTICIKAK